MSYSYGSAAVNQMRTFKAHSHQHLLSFKVSHNSNTTEIVLPSTATVSQLTETAKTLFLSDLHTRFVCLQSVTKNQMVDYVLLQPNEKLSAFKNNQRLRVYTCSEPHLKGKKYCLSDFIFLKCLGEGGSASVYLVRRRTSGKLYALKQIDKEYFVEFKRMEQILREKKILTDVVKGFPFCAKLYSSFQSQRHLNFLLEYYPGGQLFLHLQRRKLKEHEVKLYFSEIVMTFQFLHSNKVIYRDLKPQNIMIDFQGHIRLSDFGLCKLHLEDDESTYSFCGSLEYMAPQVRDSHGYSYPVDFYTMGAFLYEMLVGVPPYYNNQPLQFPESISRQATNMIKGLIEKQPRRRINSFDVIRKNPWLQGVNWKEVYNKKYDMPIKLSLYDSYIHQEFSKLNVDSLNAVRDEKFDGLFSMFEYQYKGRLGLKKVGETQRNKSKSKDSKNSKDRSRKSNHSSDSKNSKSSIRKLPSDPKVKTKPKLQYFIKKTPSSKDNLHRFVSQQSYRPQSPGLGTYRSRPR